MHTPLIHSLPNSHIHPQEREERERQARTKAQMALAEKASELTLCVALREGLEGEMEKCGDELLSVTQTRSVLFPYAHILFAYHNYVPAEWGG